jgi:mono/diheme cytochrome c family protein
MKISLVAGAGLLAGLLATAPSAAQQTRIERGEYLIHAGGCISCHTAKGDEPIPLAGGRALESPFGTFYAPNITPDQETGIGTWTNEDFLHALQDGLGPDGQHYFPAFPYPSYTGMSEDDALAIKAHLFSLEPVRQANQEHDLAWYLSFRITAGIWKLINFQAARFEPDPDRSAEWNRGAYLVRHLGHCGECHTPRNFFGAVESGRELSGGSPGSEGKKAPDITPNPDTGIGRWSESEIDFFLEMGMLPDGDFVGGDMVPVIDDNTSHLNGDDRQAIAVYLKSVPPSDGKNEPAK